MKKTITTFVKLNSLIGMCLLLTAAQCLAQQGKPSGINSTYTFYQTGNNTSIVPGTDDTGNHCDDCTTAITLPFDYTLYGTTYTTALVSSNGNIQFTGDDSSYNSSPLPNSLFSNTIFVYWSDLVTDDAAAGQGIFTSVSGTAPNRVFNIEWRTRLFNDQGKPGGSDAPNAAPDNNFELRLFEGEQKFDVIYGPITTDGSQTTSGVQKDMTDATTYQYNNAGSLFNGLSYSTALGPTQALVTVGGRVTTQFGEGIPGARVTLTDSDGVSRMVMAGKFGNFRFREVLSGAFYILTVNARGYTFTPRAIPVVEDMLDLTVTPQ